MSVPQRTLRHCGLFVFVQEVTEQGRDFRVHRAGSTTVVKLNSEVS